MVEKVIKDRAFRRVPNVWMRERGITEAYVAGNCLNRYTPHDIDLFPVTAQDCEAWRHMGAEDLLSRTKNAATYRVGDGPVVQLCFYQHPSLRALVESFDFAHVQVGAHVRVYDNGFAGAGCTVEEVHFTEAWRVAHAVESTWYIGSAYPLSSMVRTVKYAQHDAFSGKSYVPSLLNALMDVIRRGFKDYEDFKDQLDAVDLGLVAKDLEGCELQKLFERLRRDA